MRPPTSSQRWLTQGHRLALNDTAIAGHAIANVEAVTNNTREFERYRELVLEDWVK